MEHTLNCPMGGLQKHHHNEIHDLTTDMLKEVCHNVLVEPSLQPLRGEHFENHSTCTDEEPGLILLPTVFGNQAAGPSLAFEVLILLQPPIGSYSIHLVTTESSVKISQI